MKKIVIGSLALASVVLLSSCEMPGQGRKINVMPPAEEAMMKKDDALKQMIEGQKEAMEKNDSMMKKEEVPTDAMMKKDDSAMMQKDGEYTAYSPASVDAALASGKKVALFFHAPWCPSCKSLDASLSDATVPSDVVVFKVDYDSSTDLKKKYGVAGQHTIVTLDANKNKVKLERGAQDIADITALF